MAIRKFLPFFILPWKRGLAKARIESLREETEKKERIAVRLSRGARLEHLHGVLAIQTHPELRDHLGFWINQMDVVVSSSERDEF